MEHATLGGMIKPFLLIQSRPEPAAAQDEYAAFMRFGGLQPGELERLELIDDNYPPVDLARYSGVLMGGGPANFAYPPADKPAGQQAFEDYIVPLMRQIIASDTPFLGACLGIGALVTALAEDSAGTAMSFAYGEPVSAVQVVREPTARDDPLLQGLPSAFLAFVGHKEGVLNPPSSCTVLARSATCVQMIRVGQHVYATQFHPELDAEGLALRIRTYKHAGYFEPAEADALIAMARQQRVVHPGAIVQRFVDRYRQSAAA